MQYSRTNAEYWGMIISLVLLATLFLIQAIYHLPFTCHLPPWPPGHTPGSYWASRQPAPPHSFLLNSAWATSHQACKAAWDFCDPNAEPRTSPYWTSCCCPQPLDWVHPCLSESLPILKQINTPAQCSVFCKLTEGAFNPQVQIINKDV